MTRASEALLALLAALLVVLAIASWTGETAPIWDGKWYFQLASEGYGAARMEAPFVYRPGIPYLARGLAAVTGLGTEASFKLVGRAMAVLLLFAAYALGRSQGASPRQSGFIALLVALCHHHVRLPLFYWSLVDVGGFALLVTGFWWIWRGWHLRAAFLCALGLLFKEMLLVPWIAAMVELVARGERRRRAWVAAPALLGLALFLAPRLGLEIRHSQQWIDPSQPETLALLWRAPLDPARWSLLLGAALVYWMPTLLLLTRERWRALREALRPRARSLVVYAGLLFPLVMYGGLNVAVFVSYSVAAQVLVLALLLREARPPAWELGLVLILQAFLQHQHQAIPDPHGEQEAFLAFYGLGEPGTNLLRMLAMSGILLAVHLLRAFLSRSRARFAA